MIAGMPRGQAPQESRCGRRNESLATVRWGERRRDRLPDTTSRPCGPDPGSPGHFWIEGIAPTRRLPAGPSAHRSCQTLAWGGPYTWRFISATRLNQSYKNIGRFGGGQATVVEPTSKQLPPARDVLPAAGLNVEVMAVETTPRSHQFPDQLGFAQRSRVSIKRSRITIKGGVGHQQEESRARAPRELRARLGTRTCAGPVSGVGFFCQQHFSSSERQGLERSATGQGPEQIARFLQATFRKGCRGSSRCCSTGPSSRCAARAWAWRRRGEERKPPLGL